MPIDYSRWDHLEVSSSSASECDDDGCCCSDHNASEHDPESRSGSRLNVDRVVGLSSRPATSRPSTGVARSSHVKVHPSDRSVPDIYLCDPDEFVPDLDMDNFWDGAWGIEPANPLTAMMRRMSTQTLVSDLLASICAADSGLRSQYRPGTEYEKDPETQFIEGLMKKKLNSLGPSPDVDLILEVELDEIRPRVWRRFRCAANIPLLVFQDKILSPIMGWSRNYHGFLFRDPRDFSQFGPGPSCSFIDLMHMPLMGHAAIDAAAVQVGQLLRQPGDTLGYEYDLGDRWRHWIKVIEVTDRPGKCAVLDGAMRCPPEDSNGTVDHAGNDGYQGLLDLLERNPRQAEKNLRQASKAQNCKGIFDPFEFDVRRAQRVLEEALASPISAMNGSKVVEHSLHPAAQFHRRGRPGQADVVSNCGDSGLVNSFMHETVNRVKDPKDLSLCASCGQPRPPKLCASCR